MHAEQARSTKLVRNSFQVRLIGQFVGLAALALVLQFLLVGWLLARAVRRVDSSSDLFGEIPLIVLQSLGFSLIVLLPVLFGMGVLLTHRIAGPVHRFESYLRSLVRGEHEGLCKTREGDELGPLRDAINEVAAHVDALEARSSAPATRQAG